MSGHISTLFHGVCHDFPEFFPALANTAPALSERGRTMYLRRSCLSMHPNAMRARCFCSATTVSVDVSRLRRAAAVHVHEPATGLLRELQSRIRFQGSMTVAEYMTAALTHPVHGYYMQRDVFGTQGDFVTSPEISQIFGDLLGVWCVSASVLSTQPLPPTLPYP